MMPKTAILDPELTVGLPRHLTAATGMDALAHCLEAYCASGYHPMAEGVAVEGLRLVLDVLPRACADGADLDARGRMLTASAMGAVAFQKGLGAIHSLSHPIGAVYDTHHGLTNAVVMPYVLAFNRPAIEAKLAGSRWLGLPDPGYAAIIARVLSLREELGIPHTLEANGRSSRSGSRNSPRWRSRTRQPAATRCRSTPPRRAGCSESAGPGWGSP
jgi:alcohol dehydrogenase class IV